MSGAVTAVSIDRRRRCHRLCGQCCHHGRHHYASRPSSALPLRGDRHEQAPDQGRHQQGRRSLLEQGAFLDAYMANGHNATQASTKAGYSARSAASQGQRLLKDVEVSGELADAAREAVGLATQVTLQEVKRLSGDPTSASSTAPTAP